MLLAAAGAAYFFLFSGSAEAEAAGGRATSWSLEPIAVNLAGGGYLKIGVTLQFTEEGTAGGHGGGGPDGSKATDLIISTFSQAAPADVTGAREALKEALEQKIIEAYHGDVDGDLLQRVRHAVMRGVPRDRSRGTPASPHGTGNVTPAPQPHHASHRSPGPGSAPAPPVRVPSGSADEVRRDLPRDRTGPPRGGLPVVGRVTARRRRSPGRRHRPGHSPRSPAGPSPAPTRQRAPDGKPQPPR